MVSYRPSDLGEAFVLYLSHAPRTQRPMVVESSGCVHATLCVGGRPVLVWSVVGLDWMGLGKATLIHAPAAARKLLQRPFPTATAVRLARKG